MVNYSNGKIYKIESIHGGEEGDVYVGSTTAPSLSIRMAQHRCDYKGWKEGKHGKLTSYILFEKYGVENCHIVLLECVNANNKDELFARERHWIQSLRCVNKNIPGRKKPEYTKEYSEAIRIRNQQYYLDNNNRDKIRAMSTAYQLKNREYISKRRFQCECGEEPSCTNKARHLKSVIHQKYCQETNQAIKITP